jgi:hypothetical protein
VISEMKGAVRMSGKKAWKLLGTAALFGGATYYGVKKSALIDKSGSFGISLVFEPASLDFYKSYLPKTLSMPGRPLVALFVADFSILPIRRVRFREAGILLLCERNGQPGWVEVGVNVDNPLIYLQATTMMGSRKLFSNGVKLRQEGEGWSGEIRRFGKGWALSFSPKEMFEMGELKPWQEAGLLGTEFRPQITEPRYMISKIRRKVNALDLAPIFPADSDVQTGVARITVDPGQPWASLVINGAEAPAIYIKSPYPPPRDLANVWREGPIGSRLNQIPQVIDSLTHKAGRYQHGTG